jgi:hypothetical protein
MPEESLKRENARRGNIQVARNWKLECPDLLRNPDPATKAK